MTKNQITTDVLAEVFGWDKSVDIKMPDITFTDRDPPAIKKEKTEHIDNPEKKDTRWDIDDLLGCYWASEVKVEIFRNKIAECALDHSCDAEVITDIVLVHELAHWACHLGPFPAMKPDKWETESFTSHGPGIHELLAQLFTYEYCQNQADIRPDVMKMMEKLTCKQSDVYQTYKE